MVCKEFINFEVERSKVKDVTTHRDLTVLGAKCAKKRRSLL